MVRVFVGVSLIASVAFADTASTGEVMRELRRIETAGFHGDFDRVRMELAAKAQANPTDLMARVYNAWVTLPSDDAWNQLKGVAQIHPDNPWPHYGMARIYLKWKMADQAAAELATVLKKDASFYPALIVQADLFAYQERWADAEKTYRQVLTSVDEPVARAGLGFVLLKQNKKDEALAQLKQSVAAFPEQPSALATLIPLLVEAKDPKVIDVAQAAADLRPKDRDAHKLLADLRFDAQDKAGAAKEYERVLKLAQADPALLARVAALYRDLGSAADEERIVKSLAALDSANADHSMRLGELAVLRKDSDAAEKAWLDAVERDPKRVEAHLALAALRLERGQPIEALERYRLARAADPANSTALAAIEKLETEFKVRKTLKGNVNGVYWAVSASLDKFFTERKVAVPTLAGKLKVRVRMNARGGTDGVDVLEDTLNDKALLGHVYFSLRDAEYYEKKKLEPVIDFELGAKKKGK